MGVSHKDAGFFQFCLYSLLLWTPLCILLIPPLEDITNPTHHLILLLLRMIELERVTHQARLEKDWL